MHGGGGSREAGGFRKSHPSQWESEEDEDEPALYSTDDFRIRVMKVLRCSKKYCHDWTRCPFAHPGEKATRRDPMLGVYTGIACPDMRRDQRCPRGHYCPYAHNVFEYWLHPTRYRTALCRDVEKCTRKICFFAHEVHEIRTNVERPYVSPEQLVAATERASMDLRVQAEYQAAKDQRSSKPGLMTGMFSTLDDPPDLDHPTLDPSSLSLAAPWASKENQEASSALSSLMRGTTAGPLSNPYSSAGGSSPSAELTSSAFRSLPPPSPGQGKGTSVGGAEEYQRPENAVRRSFSDPSSKPPLSQGTPASDAPAMQQGGSAVGGLFERPSEPLTNTGSRQPSSWGDDLPNRQVMSLGGPGLVDEKSATMFPDHLNTMVQMPSHQSWAGQQNLMNATTHLMEGAKDAINGGMGMGAGLWSTPRGPLENPLYSTSSSVMENDRGAIEASRLDAVYKQKLRKRQAKRHGREQQQPGVGVGNRLPYAPPQPQQQQAPLYASNPSLFSTSSREMLQSLPNTPNFWSTDPALEFAQQYQQQQQQHAMQAQQNYLQSMQDMQMHHHRQNQQQQAYEQLEARWQLQQAIQTELSKLSGQGPTEGLQQAVQMELARLSNQGPNAAGGGGLPPAGAGRMPQGSAGGDGGTNAQFDLRFGSSQLGSLYQGGIPSHFEEQAQLGGRGTATLPSPARDTGSFYSVPRRQTHTGGHRRVDFEEYLEAATQMSTPQLSDIFSRMNMDPPTSSAPSKS